MSMQKFVWLVLLLCVGRARPQDNHMYSYFDEHSTIIAKGDSEFDFVKLETPIHFYSEQYDHIYVNTNGILTFVTEYPDYINQPIPLEYPTIAVFYSNIDTTDADETTLVLFFKSQNPEKLAKASDLVRRSFTGSEDFQATVIYVATWENVGYYSAKNDKVNTFQVAIICNEDETYVQFIYPPNGLNWFQAELGELGLPDIRAQAGFMSEDGRFYTVPGSATDNVRYLNSLSNINIPGVWLFRVGALGYHDNVGLPNVENLLEPPQPRTCAEGRHKCSVHASCVDTSSGFCCRCEEEYYGNGFQCIKKSAPIRVTGTISGSINGQSIDDNTKLQSYVILEDGRSYTAINPINADLGQKLQLVLPIGGAIGWLFAKPFGSAKNGFDLTGGTLNHFSSLTFSDTNEIFSVNQTFEGINYWDQLAVKVEVSGNLPPVPEGSKFQISDFMDEYRFISDNEIQSVGTIQVHVSETQTIEYSLDQWITFKRCRLDDEAELATQPPVLEKLSKISLDYHDRESAIRIGMLNKIGVDPESNPCTDGTANCGDNTICIPRGDEYDCVCKNGFTVYPSESPVDICVDIDECQGPNACDEHAYCTNELGGYSCRCIEGYWGNGRVCQQIGNSENRVDEPEGYRPPEPEPAESTTLPSQPEEPYYNENTDLTESECHKCSEYAFCVNNKCICNDGFSGDGYECIPACPPGEIWISDRCVHPDFEDQLQENETIDICDADGVCYCPAGYQYGVERNICIRVYDVPLSCHQEFNCHPNATCQYFDEEQGHKCVCQRGYEGDGTTCTKIEVSCTTKEDLCDVHASCVYNEAIGKSECRCDKGYEGNGFSCQLAPECIHDSDCGENTQCDKGVCLCLLGFERDISDFCVPSGLCGGVYCAENALCRMDRMTQNPYCECIEGFTGDGVKSCISIPSPCNVRNNCGLHATCAPVNDEYRRYECRCDPGYYGDGYLCVEEQNCRNTPNLCDPNARCVTAADGLQCICNPGFLGNGSHCKEISQHESGFLLISQGVVILRLPLDGKLGKPISVAQMAIGLDNDCAEGRIYWGDISAKKIMSSKYDGTDVKPFITEDISSPEGIAVDWISRRLYWTDSEKDTIEVANLDNSTQRATIVNKFLVNPRGIAVDPLRNKLYWSDWNRDAPKIEMSDLDGTDREIILNKPSVLLPNSLVIHRSMGDPCFADAGTGKIECFDVNKKTLRTIADSLKYPFGLSSTSDHFYWTDWHTKRIESIDIYGTRKESIRTPFFGSHKMFGMVAITDDCPIHHSPCMADNGGCGSDRLCLINYKSPSGKSCKCIHGSAHCPNDVNSVEFL
ncbi:unnamed protein product [Hermetia illucens]|uniref:Nidogen n=2 Tax=Hermetia illucens TaxID=343691 RepID=A0A7R8UDX5_HERIL|nr:unnamed protein product [Hermetia illucens]